MHAAPARAIASADPSEDRRLKLVAPIREPLKSSATLLRRGHKLSFLALFAFTLVLYARPSEFYPNVITNSLALAMGIIALALFVPTQYALEARLTAPLREVHLVLLLALIGAIGIPLAISPSDAWQTFSGTFIRCVVIFIVIVNVVRTPLRLRWLLYLAIAVGIWLSVGAINDYRLGLMTVEGYRVAGRGGGIFGNSNDMALFLVSLVPIAIALALRSRGILVKIACGLTTALMMLAVSLTYSRGGFIGLMVALGFLGWRAGNRHRLAILMGGLICAMLFLVVAPGGYGLRLASIVFPSLDPVGSADARRGELFRSLYVALRHPLLGIGMGNYASQMSYRGLVTHNSYTQVAAEMGMAALYCYPMFILTPLRKLGQIVKETSETRTNSDFYYLAVGLQAALIGYLVSSFFASVAYLWYAFYLVGYAVCLRRLYESETGKEVVLPNRAERKKARTATLDEGRGVIIT